jgi:uncharacterized membrane-anchored protein YjiN (DUF445 family)
MLRPGRWSVMDGVAHSQASSRSARAAPPRHRNHVGTASLLIAVGGVIACHLALRAASLSEAVWLRLLAAGFEAAVVGGLADWFAVTALFRHPLGLPIPHTAIIPARRAKIIESIVSMVQGEWLSPDVIGARLTRFAPSELVVDWLRDPAHVRRLGSPMRDLLRGLARLLTEHEVVEFVERTIRGQLRALTLDASAGRWLRRVTASDSAAAAFRSVALSAANLARQPETAETLEQWLDRTARQLHRDGKRLVPLLLRRKLVQRKIVEASCDYATAEFAAAACDAEHPLRRFIFTSVEQFADRLASGDAAALAQVEQLRRALVDSLAAAPMVQDLLAQLRCRLEGDLGEAASYLSDFVDRRLHTAILDLLHDAERRAAFDRWVRGTADDLLQRYHHQIGVTVRESLEALDTDTLVARIEDRVGADLQFIRLNGAVVGGLIGVLLAVAHRLAG